MAKNPTTVVGVFDSRDRAERAVADLRALGFRDDQIGVALRDGDSTGTMAATDTGSRAAGGAAAGAVVGGLLGAAAALLVPGIGPASRSARSAGPCSPARPPARGWARSPAPWSGWACPRRRRATTRASSRPAARS